MGEDRGGRASLPAGKSSRSGHSAAGNAGTLRRAMNAPRATHSPRATSRSRCEGDRRGADETRREARGSLVRHPQGLIAGRRVRASSGQTSYYQNSKRDAGTRHRRGRVGGTRGSQRRAGSSQERRGREVTLAPRTRQGEDGSGRTVSTARTGRSPTPRDGIWTPRRGDRRGWFFAHSTNSDTQRHLRGSQCSRSQAAKEKRSEAGSVVRCRLNCIVDLHPAGVWSALLLCCRCSAQGGGGGGAGRGGGGGGVAATLAPLGNGAREDTATIVKRYAPVALRECRCIPSPVSRGEGAASGTNTESRGRRLNRRPGAGPLPIRTHISQSHAWLVIGDHLAGAAWTSHRPPRRQPIAQDRQRAVGAEAFARPCGTRRISMSFVRVHAGQAQPPSGQPVGRKPVDVTLCCSTTTPRSASSHCPARWG